MKMLLPVIDDGAGSPNAARIDGARSTSAGSLAMAFSRSENNWVLSTCVHRPAASLQGRGVACRHAGTHERHPASISVQPIHDGDAVIRIGAWLPD
jgi:hypothetical protein